MVAIIILCSANIRKPYSNSNVATMPAIILKKQQENIIQLDMQQKLTQVRVYCQQSTVVQYHTDIR